MSIYITILLFPTRHALLVVSHYIIDHMMMRWGLMVKMQGRCVKMFIVRSMLEERGKEIEQMR
jgi:hypothetical protein